MTRILFFDTEMVPYYHWEHGIHGHCCLECIPDLIAMITLEENINKIKKFKEYEQNWNGYDAESFAEDFLNSIEAMLPKLKKQPQIFPVSDGSIQFEYDGENGEYLEVQLSQNNQMKCYFEADDVRFVEQAGMTDYGVINRMAETLL